MDGNSIANLTGLQETLDCILTNSLAVYIPKSTRQRELVKVVYKTSYLKLRWLC